MPKQPYFAENGEEVPSVTQITGKYKNMSGLMKWYYDEGASGQPFNAKRDRAGNIGTAMHHMISSHITGHSLDASIVMAAGIDQPMVHILFDKFRRWWEGLKVMEVICTEKMLVSERYRYGGTPDLVALDANGTAVIFDWKTSSDFYQEMLMQGAAYRQLVGEATGVIAPTAQFILIAKDRPRISVYTLLAEHMDPALDKFITLRAAYELEDTLDSIVKRIRKDAVRHDYSYSEAAPGTAQAG